MNLTDVAIDIAIVSVLLLFGFVIREKIPFFRKYFIPASLVAGILGLLLGPQVLGSVSPVHITYSKSISQWVNFALSSRFPFAYS